MLLGIGEYMRIMCMLGMIVWLAIGSVAHAELKITLTEGNPDPLPIALNNLVSEDAEIAQMGKDIMRVVSDDLERSGLFKSLNKRSFIEKITIGETIPHFVDWRQIGALALVTGSIEQQSDGQISIGFRLWDSFAEKQLLGKQLHTWDYNWRRVAHLIADAIYIRLTGESGYFDTRIVYIAESGPANKRVKRLAIMDQDGENHAFLTDGKDLVLTPRFSPNSQELLYLSYRSGVARVFLRDLQTGREEMLGRFDGMSFAPRFSASGKQMVMSIARDGNTEIFSMDLSNRRLKKLTNHRAIDTSPSFSPNGKRLVFNSDRGGSQQLYVMQADGSATKRISFGDGRYGTPLWSPRGDWIAFTKMSKGRFYIGIMRPDGSGERLLTESYLDEGPTWSPNGRVIMFTRQQRSTRTRPGHAWLYSVDITGYNLRRVMTPMDASDPAWSTSLPM